MSAASDVSREMSTVKSGGHIKSVPAGKGKLQRECLHCGATEIVDAVVGQDHKFPGWLSFYTQHSGCLERASEDAPPPQ